MDGSRRIERGEVGEPAEIKLNGNLVSISKPISKNDIITIKPSTTGSAAKLLVSRIRELNGNFHIIFNGKELSCPKLAEVNGKLVSGLYEVAEGDNVVIRNYYTLPQIMEMLDLPYHSGITDNASYTEEVVQEECNSYEELPDDEEYVETDYTTSVVSEPAYKETANAITFGSGEDAISIPVAKPEPVIIEENKPEPVVVDEKPESGFGGVAMAVATEPEIEVEDEKEEYSTETFSNPSAKNITVKVNNTEVKLSGKMHYLLVDVLDFYTFDMSEYRGRLILEVNGVGDMDFTSPIQDGDQIRIAWSE